MRVRRQFLVMAGAGVLAAGWLAVLPFSAADAAGAARPAVPAGGWGKAVTLRGASGPAGFGISALSCPSPGNCGAGGPALTSGSSPAFVVSEVHGTWGRVLVVAGLASGNGRESSGSVDAVSCSSAGNCVAAGSYRGPSWRREAFIVTQRRGTWGKAAAVPGLASLNKGNGAGLGGISCTSAGNCSAAGSYTARSGVGLPFVISEVHGIWGDAEAVPGIGALPGLDNNAGASIGPISCGSAGNCGAAGQYAISGGGQEVFVVSQVNGVWGSAMQIPGTAALNTDAKAAVSSISCPSPGNCGAGGYYSGHNLNGFRAGFVVSQVHGIWGSAIEVPGLPSLAYYDAGVSSISCPSAGNCGAGGFYVPGYANIGDGQVFVVSEVDGTWQDAMPVPGAARLNKGDDAGLTSISCPTAGNCSAGGYYTPGAGNGFPYSEAFVVSETDGTWGIALEVPGTGARNTESDATVTAVSCAAPGRCSAAGWLLNTKAGYQTFAVSKS